ncbi:adenosylcobalamin-dependent ribonucleoside-diphosphate reductase [Saccharopolyspora phatthalungensis]|uniref:Vitamin B12-dependent ribonucleotide reductase n=1 Tax=Saccharopolyspora phatthalungensis TaxID=664693 RepID=A0A840Q0F1_9PSEU|nr:adenosylcobalamin-dependent ribonucleoside-diphosphate reductase [Saccharopolyspora phatthalungensis]MBB5156012.1 ribonucleoside-diphosphate reductase alpha chain [Saccharopolyspora phatthalungensis]
MSQPGHHASRWPTQVRRRDGRLVDFDVKRIEAAIARAAREVGHGDGHLAGSMAEAVADGLGGQLRHRVPTVEQIQDAVERRLVAEGQHEIARAYVVYRQRRAELREAKALLRVRDELKLSLAAVTVLRQRYLRRDAHGHPVESTGEMLDRVATFVAAAEDTYQAGASEQWAQRFSTLLRSLDFLPNSPTLMNAGTPLGFLSGCVVLPVEDSLRSIFSALQYASIIQQAGGGTGYAFSRVRPAGDLVASTGGTASGPVPFLRVFDTAADVVRQGGRRRGANMAVLDVSHPDIYEFVTAKAADSAALENFNLSVAVSNAFLRAVEANGTHRLVNPRTGRTTARVPAADLFDAMCESAHRCGDPGLLFLDTINRANPLPHLGRIEATNPCGEVPLLPYESCNLGSINLAHCTADGRMDWDRLTNIVEVAVRFLDDVIDVSRYPFDELEQAARASRKIGLGFMGLAEMLASLGVPYDSAQAVRLAGRIARHVQDTAHAASARLAESRGAFPAFADSAPANSVAVRNAQLTSIAPTGTISLIAGTTAGIEPMFAIAYARNVLDRHLLESNPCFERLARDRGFYSDALLTEIARTGGVRGNRRIPEDVRAAFPTALEIAPEWHLRMQAAVQRHVDAAVSKTINLPTSATVDDVRKIFLEAWRAKVKGITAYRYGSRPHQVLTLVSPEDRAAEPPLRVDTTFVGGCAAHTCEF